jgi:hypothetical protein
MLLCQREPALDYRNPIGFSPAAAAAVTCAKGIYYRTQSIDTLYIFIHYI